MVRIDLTHPDASRAARWASRTTLAAACAIALGLAGCGGGSSGGDDDGSSTSTTTGSTSDSVFARGPVTGFGSVVVNGRRFSTEDAAILFGDESDVEARLHVGQIVEVQARRRNGLLVAQSVRYEASLKGPITALAIDNNRFEVAGQSVKVVGATVFDDDNALDTLAIGDVVEISGERTGAGFTVASYVDLDNESDADAVTVTGDIRNLDTQLRRFTVGGLTIDYGNAELEIDRDGGLANRLLVKVEGRLDANDVLLADKVEDESYDKDFFDDGAEVELFGQISELAGTNGFVLRGVTIRFDGNTKFDDGGVVNLGVGAVVEVEGIVDDNGILLAKEISFDEDFGDRDDDSNVEDDDRREDIEFAGRVSSVAKNAIELFGVTVRVEDRTRLLDERDDRRTFSLADIQPGDRVELAARNDDGTLFASRIEREDDQKSDEIEGFIDRFDGGLQALVVSGVTIDATAASFDNLTESDFFAMAKEGVRIEISGRFNGSVFVADEIELDD
ncbi:hypothetical protein C84B14_12988 [Salinisphaera sp. C84B14]|uniref:DUF5666 domain-containing protein n=1 Tax=Salinisphaera sp. C84B14 TaxID=1304155 RepID=UPI003340F177